MAALLLDTVSSSPGAVAVVDGDRRTDWATLDRRVDRLVAFLRSRGLREGDHVVLFAGNQLEAVESSLACLHAGLVLVPVNWHWVAPEVAYVLEDAGATALIVGAEWADRAAAAVDLLERPEQLAVRLVTAGDPSEPADVPPGFERYEDALEAGAGMAPLDPVRGGVMFYTSGTTGHPKGVRSALADVGGPPEMWSLIGAGISATLDLAPEAAVQLVCGPMYHSAQWVCALAPLLCGATLVLQHRYDARQLLELIDSERVTNLHLVPAQMTRLVRLPDEVRAAFTGSSLHQVHHGAAPCPAELKRQMIEWWGPVVTEYYGGTEGGFIATISAAEWLERPTSVGRPVSTMEVVIVDDSGEPVEPGTVGDVYFKSLLGNDFSYHNAPDKTDAAHSSSGYGTLGDVGHVDDEGYLFLSDRRIDMVISGGVNIYPAEIESVLCGHRDVVDVAVFGIPDDEMGERVTAALELAPGATDEVIAELEALCRRELAGYKCPREWVVHDQLPRTDVGKLAKRQLRDPYWADRSAQI